MESNKVSICDSHLPELYEALNKSDLNSVKRIEHKLTKAEECVACAYLFKTKGSVRDALESYLQGEGFDVEANSESRLTIKSFVLRFSIFLLSLAFVLSIESLIKTIFLKTTFLELKINVLELTLIITVSIAIFVVIDDFLFD